MKDRLRVATLNVFGHHGNWPARRQVLQQGFRDLRPDLMAFQEVIKTADDDQIADFLDESCHVVHQAHGKVDDNGVAIASRWPIVDACEFDLNVPTHVSGVSTFALIAKIDIPQPIGPLLFATYPTEYRPGFELGRERQAVAAARVLESLVDEQYRHAIVAGDMNADPDAASMRFWTGRQSLDDMSVCYRDAWESAHPGEPGMTFSPANTLMGEVNWDWPFLQIDHILVRCSMHGLPTLDIRSCEHIFHKPVNGVWGSDHFGVMADLTPPPHPEP